MEKQLIANNGPRCGQKGLKWLLWTLSIFYGILWYPVIFIYRGSLDLLGFSTPLCILRFLFETFLPFALAAGVIGGWVFYAKGDFRRARRTVLAPIICLAIAAIFAFAPS